MQRPIEGSCIQLATKKNERTILLIDVGYFGITLLWV